MNAGDSGGSKVNSGATIELLRTDDVLHAAFPSLRGVPASGHARECEVHVIPQGGEPRWMVLGNPRNALPVLSSWRPWNLGSRLRWRGALFAAATGVLPYLPGVKNSSFLVDPTYWSHNLPELNSEAYIVIHVGNPSYTRKAILFFVDRGRIRFVAKVPLTDAGAAAILNEAAVLSYLDGRDSLPRMLFQDAQRGIAVQSWLEGKPVARGFSPAHIDLLKRLVSPGRVVKISDFKPEIVAQVAALNLPFDETILGRALDLLDFDEPLPSFVEHRDFAPWNLKWIAKGRLGLLDWEWSISHGLPWQDICRFFYIEDVHFNGPGRVWEVMRTNSLLREYLECFAIPAQALLPLTIHYLVRSLCLDWRSGNERLARYSLGQIQRLLCF